MKYRDPVTGEFKDITVKVADTLPVGTIVEYEGTEIPDGYVEVEDTPKIPTILGNTQITFMQLSYNNGWKLYIKAITDGAEHEFNADLTQLS